MYLFLNTLMYLVFADVILSWLRAFGLNIRPRFLSNLLEPAYALVKKYIPTQIGPFEFTPIVIIIILSFFQMFLL